MKIIILVLFSYLLGSVSFGYIFAKKRKNIDIRKVGSGSTGATNTARILGLKYAALVFLLDVIKGFLAVFLAARFTSSNYWVIILCAYAVIIGHNWPIFFSFKGGRGSATTLGVLFGIMPLPATIILSFIILIIIALTRYVSLGSLIGAILIPVLMICFSCPLEYYLFGIPIVVLVIWRHLPNIERLRTGREPRLGEMVDIDN